MQARTKCLVAISAVFLAVSLVNGDALAAPKGWQCTYGINTYNRTTSKIYYLCSGKKLTETRRRARMRCRNLPSCVPGACIPLDHTPRSFCGRE